MGYDIQTNTFTYHFHRTQIIGRKRDNQYAVLIIIGKLFE